MAAPAIAMTREMNGTCSGEAPLVPPVDVVVGAELVLVLELEAVLLPVEVEFVEVLFPQGKSTAVPDPSLVSQFCAQVLRFVGSSLLQ